MWRGGERAIARRRIEEDRTRVAQEKVVGAPERFFTRAGFLARPHSMRWLGLGRKAGLAPYVAICVGVVSGNYLFAEPLKEHFAKQGAGPKK